MQALLLQGPGDLVLADVEPPRPPRNSVVVQVEIAGFGGSETSAFQNPGLRPLPNIMGHSICGVTDNGRRVAVFPLTGCQQCSYCDQNLPQLCADWSLIGVQTPGGFAELVVAPENALVDIPATITWEQACFIEPFANSLNAWERIRPKPSDSILIVGAGSLGLGVAAIAKDRGHPSVSVIDKSASRQNAAHAFGASPIEATTNKTFDVVFETVGSEQTRSIAINRTRKLGRTVFLGFDAPTHTVDFPRMIREQKTFLGSFVFSRAQFEQVIPLAQMCQSDWVRNLIFHEIAGELAEYAAGNFNPVKSALRINRVRSA